jgi:8-oxo-dGTP pyrophosphatase MutT (NUDIX family)
MGWVEEALQKKLQTRSPRASKRKELRPAAVLIPLVSTPGNLQLLLTRRASNLRRQPGDISFPGGAIDATDPGPLAAALRESEEEVGLRRSEVVVLGQMDEHETVTGFRVTPFVGSVKGPYTFEANHEVAELIWVPLTVLRQPGLLKIEHRRYKGETIPVYHYLYKGYDIWGITGRIIKELLDLIPEKPPTT